MKLAKYERRSPLEATRITIAVSILIGTIACIVTMELAPLVIWVDDHTQFMTATWLAQGWQDYFRTAFSAMSRSDDIVATMSTTLVASLVATAQWTSDNFVMMALGRVLAVALTAVIAAASISYAMMISNAPVVDTREHVDGMRLLRGKEGLGHLRAITGNESGKQPAGLEIAPGVSLAKLREIRGTLILGAIGSGKTRILLYILDRVLDAIKTKPQRRIRLLVHDTTGELLDGLPLEDNQFAALHGARPGGWAWAIGRDVLTASDAESVADAMAPKTGDMWGAGASIFLAAAQIKCQHEHNTSWGIAEFYDNLLEDPITLKPLYERIYPVAASLIEIDPVTGALSKTTVSFLLTFRAAVLRYLRPLAENWRDVPGERQFSFIEWLEGSNPAYPAVVVLQRAGKYPQMSAAWIGAVVDTIAGHVNDASFSNSQDRRVLLALEELATLGKLKNFSTLLDTGRNKGIGVFASVQEPEQLAIHYGNEEAKTILKRFRTKIICQQVLDADTDDFSIAHIGKRTVIETTETKSATTVKGVTTTAVTRNETNKEVPSIRGERLAYDLGVHGDRIRAIIAGMEDPIEAEWPLTIWPRRRNLPVGKPGSG